MCGVCDAMSNEAFDAEQLLLLRAERQKITAETIQLLSNSAATLVNSIGSVGHPAVTALLDRVQRLVEGPKAEESSAGEAGEAPQAQEEDPYADLPKPLADLFRQLGEAGVVIRGFGKL